MQQLIRPCALLGHSAGHGVQICDGPQFKQRQAHIIRPTYENNNNNERGGRSVTYKIKSTYEIAFFWIGKISWSTEIQTTWSIDEMPVGFSKFPILASMSDCSMHTFNMADAPSKLSLLGRLWWIIGSKRSADRVKKLKSQGDSCCNRICECAVWVCDCIFCLCPNTVWKRKR